MTPDFPGNRFLPTTVLQQHPQQSPRWPVWSAACMTRVGEQRRVCLNEQTTLMLNSNTALDNTVHNNSRRIVLHRGEIRVNNHAVTPLLVDTQQGVIGGRTACFNVCTSQQWTQLQVYSGTAWLRNRHGSYRTLSAGDIIAFSAERIAAEPVLPVNPAWTYGMLLADNMPLPVFIQELRRYWPGYLGIDDGLESLTVSGAFPLNHLNGVLELIADTLPVRISRYGKKRVRIGAAACVA